MTNDQLLFFNYHEYLIERAGDGPSLVVNHFPNFYVDELSLLFAATRIVRIPRCYHLTIFSDIIPQFSNVVPGKEPAALTDPNISTFTVVGTYDNNSFGTTSLTPLVPGLIPPQEFIDIVNTINSYLYRAFNPYSWQVVVENCLQFVTAGLFSGILSQFVLKSYSKRVLLQLEEYVAGINEKLAINDVKIISPRLSGYLSLDFQIPKPS